MGGGDGWVEEEEAAGEGKEGEKTEGKEEEDGGGWDCSMDH